MNDINGESLQGYFNKQRIKTAAIYGTGRIGQYFYNICKNTEAVVPFCIDIRTDYTIDDLPTRSYKSVIDGEIDCIVLASGYHYHEMHENLKHLKITKIISLWELLTASQRGATKNKINGI